MPPDLPRPLGLGPVVHISIYLSIYVNGFMLLRGSGFEPANVVDCVGDGDLGLVVSSVNGEIKLWLAAADVASKRKSSATSFCEAIGLWDWQLALLWPSSQIDFR